MKHILLKSSAAVLILTAVYAAALAQQAPGLKTSWFSLGSGVSDVHSYSTVGGNSYAAAKISFSAAYFRETRLNPAWSHCWGLMIADKGEAYYIYTNSTGGARRSADKSYTHDFWLEVPLRYQYHPFKDNFRVFGGLVPSFLLVSSRPGISSQSIFTDKTSSDKSRYFDLNAMLGISVPFGRTLLLSIYAEQGCVNQYPGRINNKYYNRVLGLSLQFNLSSYSE